MYSRDELRIFENFLQKIIERPRTLDGQPHTRDNGYIWCDDWRIIEILKYFINGRDMYLSDPPPNRLKKNPLWLAFGEKGTVMFQAEELLTIYSRPEEIVEHLRKERDGGHGQPGA